MGFNAPTMHGTMKPGVLERRQNAPGNNDYPELTKQIQQLSTYPAFIQAISTRGSPAREQAAYQALLAEAAQRGIRIPDDQILSSGGTIRDRTWMERHPVLSGVLITAGFLGGGIALGASGAFAGGAAATGAAGMGPTTAASMAGTEAALAGATVPASLGGAGALPAVGAAVAPTVAATTGKTVMGMSPETWKLIAGGTQGALGELGANSRNNAAIAAARENSQRAAGVAESGMDPFRQQMFQMRNLNKLDMLENFQPSPRVTPQGPYASVIPPQPPSSMPSAELIAWAAKMKRDIAGGQNTAPTQTNPANYGRTSALNLLAPPTEDELRRQRGY